MNKPLTNAFLQQLNEFMTEHPGEYPNTPDFNRRLYPADSGLPHTGGFIRCNYVLPEYSIRLHLPSASKGVIKVPIPTCGGTRLGIPSRRTSNTGTTEGAHCTYTVIQGGTDLWAGGQRVRPGHCYVAVKTLYACRREEIHGGQRAG